MGFSLKNIDWKAILNATVETLKSIGRGDILLRMRVDKLFPYILYTFFLAWLSIWLSYKAEKTMYRVEVNKEIIENLKIDNANKTCEIVSLTRISTVEKMLKEAGSEITTPEKPAYTIGKGKGVRHQDRFGSQTVNFLNPEEGQAFQRR